MLGRLLLQSVVILWLVQTAHTGGYGAVSGVSNGQGPQPNGRRPQNGGGVGRMLMPSKGVGQGMGAQNGYGGYPSKGIGNGAAAGVSNGNGAKYNGYGAAAGVPNGAGTKGYGAAAGVANGQGGKPQGGIPAVLPNGNGAKSKGNGAQAGPMNGQQMKGYNAQAGPYGGQPTKGNGNGAYGAAQNGIGTKGNGQKATGGPSNGNGARPNGQGGAGAKPMKGFGRPSYGAGASAGLGASRGVGVPQLAGNQGTAYGANGFNGYGAQPVGGYNGGFGSRPQYGNGGMKGPKPGYGSVSGAANGQGAKPSGFAGARSPSMNGALPNGYGYPNGGAAKPAKTGYGGMPNGYGGMPNGYGGMPNGYGAKPKGYGATRGGAMRPQPGYGNGAVPNGYGTKPKGYGAAAGPGAGPGAGAGPGPGATKGNGAKSNGHGVGNGAALGGYGLNGFGVPAGAPNGQFAKAANAGYGMAPNGQATKGAGVSSGQGLKGGVLSLEQPSAVPEEGLGPQQAIPQDIGPIGPIAPEPTSGILVMVTQEKSQKLPSPVLQGKSYKQPLLIPQATPEPGPAISQGPELVPESIPELASLSPQAKGPKAVTSGPAVPQSKTALEPGAVLPQGYVTGSAVPEQKGAEADIVVGVNTSEGEAAPESNKSLKTKAVPETAATKSKGNITPEETLAVGAPKVVPEEANLQSQPEAGPRGSGVKGPAAGRTGSTENGGATSKGQGSKAATPDCGPGVPNGQWMKIPRPGYNAGLGASAGAQTKGYGAGAGVPNRFGAKPNGYGTSAGEYGASAGGYANGGGAKASKPSYGPGGYTAPGQSNGYGAGLGYPYGGKPKQPGYGQGAHLGAGYGNAGVGEAGKSKSGYGNGYGAGVQPDYASLNQGAAAINRKSGGAKQTPYNGAPMAPAGLDGMSQFQPQPAGLGPNGKLGSMYAGMGNLPFGGQSPKYGIGGMQFGGKPSTTGTNGAGKYGYGGSPYGPAAAAGAGSKSSGKYGNGGFPNGGQLGLGNNGNTPGKYGYGRIPFEAQTGALSSMAKATGQYGSSYQPEPVGMGPNGMLSGKYGGGEVPYSPQAFSGDTKSAGKYANQGQYKSQPLESASTETAGLSYEPHPLQPDTAGKSYVKGELPTSAVAAEGEGVSIDKYENVGYINGQVQPEVVAFPAAPTPLPTLPYPSAPSYLPVESLTGDPAGARDLPDPAGKAGITVDSAPATETQAVSQGSEQPDDLLQQQLPHQIHIQQHLKLHFHPQGAKNGKYDLNGFFGNGGYKG